MTELLRASTSGPPDAPVVVLSGSLGATSAMWSPQLPRLQAEHRVIALEHRGHGGSPAPAGPYAIEELGADALATLDRLGVESFSWIGLSLGGMVGMWVASENPERVRRLALLCTSARLGPPEGWRGRAATVRSAGMASVAGAVVDRWFTAGWSRSHPERVAGFERMVCATVPEAYAACCEAIADMDLTDRLPKITAETLVIAADSDPATPVPHAELIVGATPCCHLEVVSPAAHLASFEAAADVNDLLLRHLAG